MSKSVGPSSRAIRAFRRVVLEHYRAYGRHRLPWRKTHDPYKILVSEVMLQQTQVDRVISFYRRFLKRFPTVRDLAQAPLIEVLGAWSGLGYNRRAKYLRDAAKLITEKHHNRIPRDVVALRALPGVGDYTAKAVRVFAFNEPDVLIETNIRSAIIHHFSKIWTRRVHISDREVRSIAERVAKGLEPRKWHAALMDYGAYIKKAHPNPSRRSSHYAKQSKFEGSLRQVRGAILRAYTQQESIDTLRRIYGKRAEAAIRSLKRDGLLSDYHG